MASLASAVPLFAASAGGGLLGLLLLLIFGPPIWLAYAIGRLLFGAQIMEGEPYIARRPPCYLVRRIFALAFTWALIACFFTAIFRFFTAIFRFFNRMGW
jgi:hypothetical protein